MTRYGAFLGSITPADVDGSDEEFEIGDDFSWLVADMFSEDNDEDEEDDDE